MKYPVAGPWITECEVSMVNDAVKNAWFEKAGTYLTKFEAAFSDYVSVEYAICLPSCTSGIHLALAALGVGPGDEVIVPDVTWIASAAPISYVGAIPIFAEVSPETLCISHSSVSEKVSSRTKAIIVVDLYGNVPEFEELVSFCRERNILIIEDAAEALGSTLNGHQAGSFGDIGVFSFHGSKTLTTGEGGMLVTSDRKIYERVRFLADHGRIPGDKTFRNTEVAFKYKMSDLQAALGLAQLQRIDELVSKKREISQCYKKYLGAVNGFYMLKVPHGCESSCWMSTLLWDKSVRLDKYSLVERLAEYGIGSRPVFNRLTSLEAYRHMAAGKNTQLGLPDVNGINLPSALVLSESDIEAVAETLLSFPEFS